MRAEIILELLNGRPWLTRKDVAQILSITARSVDRLRVRGLFPAPFYVSGPRWTTDQILKFQTDGAKVLTTYRIKPHDRRK
jgi:hypothetical protein